MNFEYPLKWLPQQPRTKQREYARFANHSASKAGDYLIHELEMMGAKYPTISSNLKVRTRGDGFYAVQKVEDPGVVVYFELKGKGKAMACDKWRKVEHNLWSLYLSVQAIRGLERWGGSEFLDGLFDGFQALPAPEDVIQTTVQFFSDCVTQEEVKRKYRHLVKELHPDVGGSLDEFNEMQCQYEVAKSKGGGV
jgi:hypothetical protein